MNKPHAHIYSAEINKWITGTLKLPTYLRPRSPHGAYSVLWISTCQPFFVMRRTGQKGWSFVIGYLRMWTWEPRNCAWRVLLKTPKMYHSKSPLLSHTICMDSTKAKHFYLIHVCLSHDVVFVQEDWLTLFTNSRELTVPEIPGGSSREFWRFSKSITFYGFL